MSRLRHLDARPFIAGLLLLAGLLAVAVPAAADPKSRLEKIEAEKAEAARNAARFDAKRDEILGRIKVLDKERAKVEAEVAVLDVELTGLDRRIETVTDRLTAAQQKVTVLTEDLQEVLGELSTTTDLFTERAIVAYKAGPGAYLDSILGSESFSELVDRTAYWDAALDADSVLIETMQVLRGETEIRRNAIIERQRDIAAAKRQLETDRRAVAAVRTERDAVLAERETLLTEKESILGEVEQRKAYYEALEDQLAQDAARIESVLASGSSGNANPGSGQFLWPTHGALTSPYGYRTHPIFGDRRLHTGIDIGGSYGAPVWAADTGTVTYVGVMSGYGNVVVVDHGGGLATTYNHLSSQSVSSGSIVQRGTVVGAVGCTGYCTGPHLHFEVRVNGSPVDPMPYL